MNRLKLIIAALSLAALASSSLEPQRATARASGADRTFFMKSGMGNLAEIEQGGLAIKRGSAGWVKQFGQMLVSDHGAAQQSLGLLGNQMGWTLPTRLNSKEQAAYNRLANLTGARFDMQFRRMQISMHRAAISLHSSYARRGRNTGLRSYASRVLPNLRRHLSFLMQRPSSRRK